MWEWMSACLMWERREDSFRESVMSLISSLVAVSCFSRMSLLISTWKRSLASHREFCIIESNNKGKEMGCMMDRWI